MDKNRENRPFSDGILRFSGDTGIFHRRDWVLVSDMVFYRNIRAFFYKAINSLSVQRAFFLARPFEKLVIKQVCFSSQAWIDLPNVNQYDISAVPVSLCDSKTLGSKSAYRSFCRLSPPLRSCSTPRRTEWRIRHPTSDCRALRAR